MRIIKHLHLQWVFSYSLFPKMKNLISWFILLGLVIVWGSSFILIKKSLLYFNSDEVGVLRIVITFLFL